MEFDGVILYQDQIRLHRDQDMCYMGGHLNLK